MVFFLLFNPLALNSFIFQSTQYTLVHNFKNTFVYSLNILGYCYYRCIDRVIKLIKSTEYLNYPVFLTVREFGSVWYLPLLWWEREREREKERERERKRERFINLPMESIPLWSCYCRLEQLDFNTVGRIKVNRNLWVSHLDIETIDMFSFFYTQMDICK